MLFYREGILGRKGIIWKVVRERQIWFRWDGVGLGFWLIGFAYFRADFWFWRRLKIRDRVMVIYESGQFDKVIVRNAL